MKIIGAAIRSNNVVESFRLEVGKSSFSVHSSVGDV